jgi:sulfatase maturation enzyme AslB (radical SAM superfamily)
VLCDRDWRTHHCQVCEFKDYCGGCRARADAYYGELNAGDPGCVFNAKHWDELVRRDIVADPAFTAQPSHADRRPVTLSR